MRKKLWAALTVVASLTLFSGCAIKDSLMHSPIGFLFGSQHKWEDGKWDSDENGHWTACSEEICTERKNYSAHTYDNVCDDDCNVCGAKRTPAHKYKVVSYKADCENDARTVEVCMLCNQEGDVLSTQVGSAIGHDWKMDYVVIDPDRNFCEDGGRMADVCQNCKKVEIHSSGSRNHVSSDWKVDVEPTKTAEGALIGKCETCGKEDAKIKLPVLSEENYAYEEVLTKSSCLEREGKEYYTIYVNSNSILSTTESAGSQKFQIVVNAEPMPHTLNNVKMVKDEYSTKTAGIIEFGGEEADCSGIKGRGFYVCDKCHKNCEVTTFEEHNDKVEVITPATCTTPGEQKKTCLDCGDVRYEPIPAKKHNIKNTLERIGEDEFQIVSSCQREECGFSEIIPFDGTIANGKVEKKITKNPTCQVTGIVTYSAKYEGETIYGEEVLNYTAHILNETLMEADDYALSTKGVHAFAGMEPTCTQQGEGFYVCEVCSKNIKVTIAEEPHPYKILEETKATCTQAGYVFKECEVCGFEKEEYPKATGHDFTFKDLVTPTYDETGSVVVYCVCKDLSFTVELPTLDSSVYTKQVLSTATCEKAGLTEYKLDVLNYYNPDLGLSYELTFKADIEVSEHYPLSSIIYTWEETIYESGRYVTYVYTGKTCETCKRLIVMTKVRK